MSKLRVARYNKGLTQSELAELSGLKQTTISALELGRRRMTRKLLKRLLPHLGVTAAELGYELVTVVDVQPKGDPA